MDKPASNGSHDPHVITPGCPVDCLGAVLSRATFNPLARAYDAPFDPPETVGDVLRLREQGQLGKISGLGRRRIGEIEVGLVFAGFSSEHGASALPRVAAGAGPDRAAGHVSRRIREQRTSGGAAPAKRPS